MNYRQFLFALLFLFALAPSFLKGEEMTQPASSSLFQPLPAFYPLDNWPELSDFNTILKLHTPDFEAILPHFLEDSFYELPGVKAAISDHYLTWGEMTDFLNNIAWHNGNNARYLYTGTLAKTIMRKCEKVSFFEPIYTYEVSPELAAEPALLSLATMQRYVNWREGHYWRYGRLLDQEKGITDPDDAIVSYFKNHLLWPIIKLDQNIDNLYDVVEKSTEVGTFGFSEEGNNAEKMSSDVSYRFPTQEEISSWRGIQKAGKVWGITTSTATDPAACSAFDTATGEEIEVSQDEGQECYGILALNTEKMKSTPDFQKKEQTLQGERSNPDFLRQDLLKATNDRAAYNKEKEGYDQATFSIGTTILDTLDGVALLLLGYQTLRYIALQLAYYEVDIRCLKLLCTETERKSVEELYYMKSTKDGLHPWSFERYYEEEFEKQKPTHLKVINDSLKKTKWSWVKAAVAYGATALLKNLGNSYMSSY